MINPIRIGLVAALFVSFAANTQTNTPTSAEMHGAHANGIAFNGMVLNGVKLNGKFLNGLKWNGWSLNGRFLNGLKWNGLKWNGLKWNGSELNGWSLNGLKWNGLMLDGRLHPTDGAASPTAAAVPFFAWKPVMTEADWSALPVANVQVRLPAAL